MPRYIRSATVLTVVAAATGCARNSSAGLPPIPVTALQCKPSTLRAGDTLTIAVPQQLARELSIETPREVFFQLVSVSGDPAMGPQLMSPDSLQAMRELRLSVATLSGRPYVHGATATERIFSTSGTYRIRIAERLGTDDGTPVAMCEVSYKAD